MKGIEKLRSNWYALIVPAAIITGLLGSMGLPALFPWLSGPRFRLGIILAVVILFGGAAALRAWRMRRGAAKIADGIAAPAPGKVEAAAVSARLREALAHLRSAAGRRRDYLYAKPWYVIIGPPGAGKTSAFVNSGLRFPFADAALKGEGGTRNLDFWFADEAVLVDTAGRYTTQDSDREGDAGGWEAFLRLLRRTRPREPINGVIVTLGVDTLTTDDRQSLDAHAAAIRRRLRELRKSLGVSVPVYLLLTKVDLLAGFADFFAELTAEGRRAVLGATLPVDAAISADTVVAAFDGMAESIGARSARRLQKEPDGQRRSRILGFPTQLVALRSRFARFVGGILPADEADGHRLRGFYFASSKQEGAPLDRLLASLSSVYEEQVPVAAASMRGRAFFLNRLFAEVVFPEAGMVRTDDTLRRRRRIMGTGGIAAVGVVALAMLLLWDGSFLRNKGLQAAQLSAARDASDELNATRADLATVHENDADLGQLLPVLDRLRALPGGYADQTAGRPSWRMRLGLYQSGHARAARETYLDALQRIMLPRLLLEAERAIRSDEQTPIRLYEPLRAYLMLGGYGPMDVRSVKAWVLSDWADSALPGEDRADIRHRLALHLDALLHENDLGRVWAGGRAPLDGRLLAGARAAVIGLPLADRAYAMMREHAAASGRPDWRADALLTQSDARAFGNGPAVMALSVPWFLTRDGYQHAYQPGLANIAEALGRDLWVLGPDADKGSMRAQLPALHEAVARDYARDYIAAWDRVLQTPQSANYFGDRAALGSFTRTPSPLKALVLDTARNTMLGGAAPVPGAPFDAGAAIRAHFLPVAAFAKGSGGSPAPVDALIEAVRQAASAGAASTAPGANLGGDASGRFASALGDLSTSGATAPPQLQGFVGQLGRTGAGAATRSATSALNDQYVATVLPDCRQASLHRYPFDPGASADIAPADLQRVFGTNGDIDSFVRVHLQPLLMEAPAHWQWRTDDPVAARFSPASADAFRRAAAIRDIAAGGLALQVSVAALDEKKRIVDLAVGDTHYLLHGDDTAPHAVMWTAAALPAAHVALLKGKKPIFQNNQRGSFALFRLIAAGQARAAGPGAMLVTYGPAGHRVVLRIAYPTPDSPFARNGPFSFRCPESL